MRYHSFSAIIVTVGLTACQSPDIDDWPPTPIETDAAVIDRYVGTYGTGATLRPPLSDTDLDTLRPLRRDRADGEPLPDIARFDRRLEEIEARRARRDAEDDGLSPGEIRTIERRLKARYPDDRRERQRILRSRYGL